MDLTSITIIVSGKRFPTKINTLLNSEYFTGIIELNKNCDRPLEEINVEDKSPKIFGHILEYLRNRFYKLPRNCEEDLKFYGINYDNSNFKLTIKDIYDQQSELSVLFSNQYEELDSRLDKLDSRIDDLKDKICDLQEKNENDHKCLTCSSDVYYDSNSEKYSKYCSTHVCQYSTCRKKATVGCDRMRRCENHQGMSG
jgi:hypothetical protein